MTDSLFALGGLGFVLCLSTAMAQEPRGSTAGADSPNDELTGFYTLTSGENSGEKLSPDRVEGTTVRFSRDRILVADREKKELYAATYTLDARQKPWRVTMTSKLPDSEQTVHGLLEKEGDTVRLIYALPGAEPPTEFKTADKQLLFVMTRGQEPAEASR
jgi:uncharacterized protein (TIGR03067 family)